MLPLSPRHLLYTKVGADLPDTIALSWNKTDAIQKVLIEHAHRWVFAEEPIDNVRQILPRIVDPEQFQIERQAEERWHEEQRRGELGK